MDNEQIKAAARLISVYLIQKGALEIDLDRFAVERKLTAKEVVAIHRGIRAITDEMMGNNKGFNSIPEIIEFVKASPSSSNSIA